MRLDDIAEMHHCSLRHARDVLIKIPGFPTESTNKHAQEQALASI